jgi:predicted metal-dependent peptidase
MDKKLQAEALEKLTVARVKMLFQTPFWGNIATRFALEANDDWCTTAATDGKKIYYNPEFIMKLTDKECIFLIGHEVLHVIYDHLGRFGDRDKQLSNIAADYCVNATLVTERLGELIHTVPVLYDKKYHEWSFEQVYDDLLQNADQLQMSGAGGLGDKVLDDHLDGDGDGESDGEGEGGNGGKPKLSKDQLQEIQNDIRSAILSAAQAVGVGNVPGNLKRFIKDLTEPKMDWRTVLHQQIESQLRNDFTWMKQSRRSQSCDAFLPGRRKDPAVEVDLALDMSGSIGEAEIRSFFSEVQGIISQFGAYKISVLCWDTKVYNYKEYTEDDSEGLMEYEPMGGGGTDASCIFEFYKDMDKVPKQLVVFTDGEIYNWGDPDFCSTSWIIKNRYRKNIVAPFGDTFYVDEDK